MTRPASASVVASWPSSAPSSCSATTSVAARLAVGELLADAQDRAQAGTDGTPQLAADQLVGLARVAPRSVADDDPFASVASIGAEISPVYAPASSWCTFCAPTATGGSSSATASPTAARHT